MKTEQEQLEYINKEFANQLRGIIGWEKYFLF